MDKKTLTGCRTTASILSVAAVSFVAGKFGLWFAVVHPSAAAIWPPAGIALAALLLWGYRLWPAVFIGAFLVNITTQTTVTTSLGIALGNTLEAVLAAWLVNQFTGGHRVFERAKNTFKFVLLAGFISTTVSATLGVTSLTLGGYAQFDRFTAIWLTWWLGDIVGCLLIAPLLIIWLTQPYPELKPRRILEAAGLLLTLLSVGYIVFLTGNYHGIEYVALLPLLWAAFRFGQRGGMTAAFVTAALALLGTIQGTGPFATGDPNHSFFHLQGFIGTISIAALVLASVITERMRAEERIEIQDAVSRILADSPDLKEAGSKILQILCERAKWDTGCIWNIDKTADQLVCAQFWHLPLLPVPLFEETSSRDRTFARGVGLPGRVWSSGNPLWIPDVTKDRNFPRAIISAAEGLRAAFGFPIRVGREILGVIECFSREVRGLDDDFLRTMDEIGGQVGRFIERTRAEEALLESEKELADFFATSPLSLHWVGKDGTILRANDAELNMLGYSAQEYIGRNIVDFHVDAKNIRSILTCLARGEIIREYPAQLRCKDGYIRDVVIDSSVYWRNGEFVHTRCFTRDVTTLKRAEEARGMLAAIVETSHDAIISKNLDGFIRSWNAGAQRLFGYEAQEIIGQSILQIIPKELHAEEMRILSRLRRGEPVNDYETVRVSRDGRLITVSLTVSPIKNAKGVITGISKIARDITERKRAEELLAQAKNELVKANEKLERRVYERTADLEQANAALLESIEEQKTLEEQLRQAQKMESIGTLAGGIAHDFNNILNIIRGYGMLASAQSSEGQQIVESMQIINEEVDRGASVVRQLLTLARKTETRLARTDANQVVISVSELIKQTFPKTISVRLKLDRTRPSVLADSNQINQALLNICVNARDAMPSGGELTLATEVIDQEFFQSRYPEAGASPHVCLAVTDTGVGIEGSVRSRIFEPFFTTKKVNEGTGLGLAMVYGIVKNHQGFIDVESNIGHGTEFRLYLPIFQGDTGFVFGTRNDENRPARDLAHKGTTVLVIEDEEAMARLLKIRLQNEGYHVRMAMDGAEAIKVYERHGHEIDLVLMDLGLPKFTGSEVIRMMKKQNPGVKIIVSTGYLEPELKSELLDAEVKDYIYKPYSVDEVIAKIQACLNAPEPQLGEFSGMKSNSPRDTE